MLQYKSPMDRKQTKRIEEQKKRVMQKTTKISRNSKSIIKIGALPFISIEKSSSDGAEQMLINP